MLKFCENEFDDKGRRQFDVNIGDTNIIRRLDILAEVEYKAQPYDVFVELEIADGEIYYKVRLHIWVNWDYNRTEK